MHNDPTQPTQSPPPGSKPDKGIPILILIPVLVVITASIFLLPPLLQKKSPSIPTTSPTQQPITNNREPITPSTTPIPTPLQGPGTYSCSLLGTCKNWDPQIQKENCTVTFADKDCLGQCGDTTKRCKF